MKNRLFSFSKFIRIFHKYLNLLISFQLLLWTISGLFFAYNKKNLDNFLATFFCTLTRCSHIHNYPDPGWVNHLILTKKI